MLIGYARVSTADQKLDLQNDALTRAGCERIFTDTASGAKAARMGLEQALAFARKGDTIVVWKLDRLGRSLRHLVETLANLRGRGSASAASRRVSTRRPAAASSSSTCLPPWPSSSATSSASGPGPGSTP